VVERADAGLAGGSEVDRDGFLYQPRIELVGSRRIETLKHDFMKL
jgi:hypothetical protein